MTGRQGAILAIAGCLIGCGGPGAQAQDPPASFVLETPAEFFTAGDFDGDGRVDVVIADKASGKYRPGYGQADGTFSWVECRPSGIGGATGFTVGRLFATNRDALAFTSPDANQIVLVDVSSPTAPANPISVPFTALGPSVLVAADIPGGTGDTPLDDLYVGSIYNSPEANLVTLMRNDRAQFPVISEGPLAGPASRGNRISLKTGEHPFVGLLLNAAGGDAFEVRAHNRMLKPTALTSGLPSGGDYTVGNFRGSPLSDFVFYKPGQSNLIVHPVREVTPGQFALGARGTFSLGEPVRMAVALKGSKLLVILGDGAKAGVFDFDGVNAPVLAETISPATNEVFTGALSLPTGFIVFSQPAGGKFSTKYHLYRAAGNAFAAGPYGALPSLADNDSVTIPDIHARIIASLTVTNESQMAPYTNTVPGTRVAFVMLPIPGGEFVMGSPEVEAGRKPDEGPARPVKIAPFWMGRCEVTWSEYELFMYPEDERQLRESHRSDPAGDRIADAVTHPSRPYVEMSFGMGKAGYPAIAMTQHAANKYCQWLSAKTGQFHRLPTEAEWEYACRAGTSSAYSFGDDPAQLGDYAWFEENSNFKYQKVGRKKPNPWGLHDMHGNVVEWVLDQYDPDFYRACAQEGTVTEPWNRATRPYPHSVRGGSWDDPAAACRSAARRGSERDWKMQDPQLPKSVWYFSDARFVGFRIVRPLQVPPPEAMRKYWTSGVEKD